MLRDRELICKAIAAGLATEEETAFYFAEPEVDPYADLDPEQRWDHVIRHAGAGIWSTCPTAVVTINGQPIPPPPAHRIRGRGPRGRSPQGRSPHPPISQTVSEEGTPP